MRSLGQRLLSKPAPVAAIVLLSVGPSSGRAASLDPLFPRRAFRSFAEVTTHGLPQHSVQALAQDAEGVLWIATFDGVATFDGHALRSVPPERGAPRSGPYYAIARRWGAGVLVGGASGIHEYDGRTWRRRPTPATVAALAESERGIWMVDLSGRVWWGDRDRPWQPVPSAVGPAVALGRGPDRQVWLAGRDGIVRLDPPGAAPMELPSAPTALLVSRSGSLWVGTEAGAVLWLPAGEGGWRRALLRGWTGGRIRALAEDRRGRVWAGGDAGSVAFGRPEEPWTIWGPHNGLRTSAVTAILSDREGDLWFGFITDGLQQWVGEAWSHRTASGDARVVITDIQSAPGGGLFVAAFDQGLWHWDGATMRVLRRESGISEDARAVVSPSPGTVWVGARFGIFESVGGGRFRRTLRLRSRVVSGVSVTGFFRAPDGGWYAISSSEGIFRHGASGWTPADELNRDLADPNVRSMVWRKSGELWVATLRGVTVFPAGGGRGRTLPPDETTGVPRHAQALLEASPDEMWVGAFGGIGIWSAGRWRVWTERDGLPGKTIYSLRRAPDGAIWAGGSHGVGRYAEGRWTLYTTNNGLLSNECNVNALWIAPNGSVFVGTMGSLARFDPSVKPLAPPPLRLFWREVPGVLRDGIFHLGEGQRSLRLAWSAPWLKPGEVQYRFRVPRLGPDWSPPVTSQELRLASLGAGVWDVEVSASADRMSWTEPRRIRFYVEPTFWETRWAWALYGVAGAALAALLALWRTRRLARRARELQAGIEAGLAQIKVLRGLLPICAVCKKIRDDQGYWNRIEAYVSEHSEAEFTHGFCPECFERLYPMKEAPREE